MAFPKAKPSDISEVLWDISAYVRAACAQSYIEGKIGTEQHLSADQATRDTQIKQALDTTEALAIRAVIDIHARLSVEAAKSLKGMNVGKGGVLQ